MGKKNEEGNREHEDSQKKNGVRSCDENMSRLNPYDLRDDTAESNKVLQYVLLLVMIDRNAY